MLSRTVIGSSRGLLRSGLRCCTHLAARPIASANAAMHQTSAAPSGEAALYPHGMQNHSPACSASTLLSQLGSTFTEVPLEGPSSFVKPASLIYQQSGKKRRWDVVQAHESVAVLLFNYQLDAYIIVRQFRPAVYAASLRTARAKGLPDPPVAAGLTFEMCAGIADKAGYTLAQVCSEEVEEEVGYAVPPEQLLPITAFISSAGITGATQHTFYAQVDESQRVNNAGGTMAVVEGVEAVTLPVGSVHDFIADDSLPKSPGLCFALLWALTRDHDHGA